MTARPAFEALADSQGEPKRRRVIDSTQVARGVAGLGCIIRCPDWEKFRRLDLTDIELSLPLTTRLSYFLQRTWIHTVHLRGGLEKVSESELLRIIALLPNNVTKLGIHERGGDFVDFMDLTMWLGMNLTRLTHLDLSQCKMQTEWIAQFTTCLATNTTLRILDMDSCGLGIHQIYCLFAPLKFNKTLRYLNLRNNCVRCPLPGDRYPLLAMVDRAKGNTTLLKLNMSGNSVTDYATNAVTKCPGIYEFQNTVLRTNRRNTGERGIAALIFCLVELQYPIPMEIVRVIFPLICQ